MTVPEGPQLSTYRTALYSLFDTTGYLGVPTGGKQSPKAEAELTKEPQEQNPERPGEEVSHQEEESADARKRGH